MKVKAGDIVEIDFLDHAEHGHAGGGRGAALSFKLLGRVVRNTKHTLVVETWCYQNRKTPLDANVVRYTIVKGAIGKCAILRKAGERTPRDRTALRNGKPVR